MFEIVVNGLQHRWGKMIPDVDRLELTTLSIEELVGIHGVYLSLNLYDV